MKVDVWVDAQSTEGLFPYGFDLLDDRPTEPERMAPTKVIRQADSVSAVAAYYR